MLTYPHILSISAYLGASKIKGFKSKFPKRLISVMLGSTSLPLTDWPNKAATKEAGCFYTTAGGLSSEGLSSGIAFCSLLIEK